MLLSPKIIIRKKIFFKILTNNTIRDGLSQKTFLRYCPFKGIVSRDGASFFDMLIVFLRENGAGLLFFPAVGAQFAEPAASGMEQQGMKKFFCKPSFQDPGLLDDKNDNTVPLHNRELFIEK